MKKKYQQNGLSGGDKIKRFKKMSTTPQKFAQKRNTMKKNYRHNGLPGCAFRPQAGIYLPLPGRDLPSVPRPGFTYRPQAGNYLPPPGRDLPTAPRPGFTYRPQAGIYLPPPGWD